VIEKPKEDWLLTPLAPRGQGSAIIQLPYKAEAVKVLAEQSKLKLI